MSLTINSAVVLVDFLFIPITLLTDGLLTFGYFFTLHSLAYLLSFGAIVTHFVFIRFTMVKKEYMWVIVTLGLWAFLNLTGEQTGIFFREMNGAKNLVKIALAMYFIMASTCLYFVLCWLSQKYHKVHERKTVKILIKKYGKATYLSDDSDSEESETDTGDGIVPKIAVQDSDK